MTLERVVKNYYFIIKGENIMKKILAVLLMLCIAVGILSGCGGGSNTPAASGKKKPCLWRYDLQRGERRTGHQPA